MKRYTTQQLTRSVMMIAFFVVIIFALIKNTTQNANAVDQKNGQAISVTAVTAREGTVQRRMMFSGPVVGRDEVPIYSELAQGRIDKIFVEAGQHVKAGTVLATVDASALRIQKAQQQANQQKASVAIKQQENALEEAQAQYIQAQADRKRGDVVAETGLISREVRDQRVMAEQLAKTRVQSMKNNLSMAQADFNLASAQLAESDLRLNQAAILSPVSGMVIERKARTGMSLAQNTEPLFNILREDDVEVELEVSADDATRLKLGMPASIQLVGDMSAAKAPKANNLDAVLSRVDAWSQAWKNKDVDTYLSFYADQFVPEQKMSKADWVAQRQKRLASKDSLDISLSQINVQVNGDKATQEFVQHYSANGKKEDSNKRLTLALLNGEWLIVREQSIANLDAMGAERPSSSSQASSTQQSTNIYNGKISRAATQINRQNQIGKVRVRFDQTPNLILGQFARVAVSTSSRSGIYLPDSAVRFEGSSTYVFTAKDGLAKRQPVKVGQHIGNKLEILDGVSAGMVVIDTAASFLRDGEPIKVTMSVTKGSSN
jgi:multidrug efflux pump subunit AcrA (membrane-fusion protein)